MYRMSIIVSSTIKPRTLPSPYNPIKGNNPPMPADRRKPKKIPYLRPTYRSHHCPNGKHNYYVMHFYYAPLHRLVKYVKCLDCGSCMPYHIFERTLGKNMLYRLSTAL
jgi:hypothetical protein